MEENYEMDTLFGKLLPVLFSTDDLSDIGIMSEVSSIDLDEISKSSETASENIVNRLAGYYFDSKYLEEHPYIKTKILTEVDCLRRTMKMLKVNEASQDSLIRGISLDPTKAALFASLTSLQGAAVTLQKQMLERIEQLESIFLKMEDDTERTFAMKDKDDTDGLKTVRGSKEFLMKLKEELDNE